MSMGIALGRCLCYDMAYKEVRPQPVSGQLTNRSLTLTALGAARAENNPTRILPAAQPSKGVCAVFVVPTTYTSTTRTRGV